MQVWSRVDEEVVVPTSCHPNAEERFSDIVVQRVEEESVDAVRDGCVSQNDGIEFDVCIMYLVLE